MLFGKAALSYSFSCLFSLYPTMQEALHFSVAPQPKKIFPQKISTPTGLGVRTLY